MASKELATLEDAYPILFGSGGMDFKEVLSENFGDEGMSPRDLERIGVPAGGGTTWEIPSLDGAIATRELVGIILHWTSPRTYWMPREDDGGSVPPDCFSDDGKVGMGLFAVGSEGNPTGECAVCPMNQWGSAADEKNPKAKGKACKEQRIIYLLRPNEIVPVALQLPPTSIQPLRQYSLRLASKGKRMSSVETMFKLTQKQEGQYKWSVAEPSMVRDLSPEQAEAAREFAVAVKA